MPDIPINKMYDDAKVILTKLGNPIIDPLRRRIRRKTLLRLFSPDFASHPADVTAFVDYYTFHEHVESWLSGKGTLNSAPYGETLRFWTMPNMFLPYEAKLMRFLRRGGEARRIFLIGPEIHDSMREWALYRTLKRHDALGFKPRVRSVIDLQAEIFRFGTACDMFGVLNGSIGYFFRFPENDSPLMLRTNDITIATRADNAFKRLWDDANTFKSWSSRWQPSVPEEIERLVKRDIECVEILSDEIKD